MNCTYIILKIQLSQNDDVDKKLIIPIEIFLVIVKRQLLEQQLNETQTTTEQQMAFKKMLSDTSIKLKKYGMSYLNQFNKQKIRWKRKTHQQSNRVNSNIAEASYTDIEKHVSIVEGKSLIDWKDMKNSQMKKLDETKLDCKRGIQVLIQQLETNLSNIKQLTKIQSQKEDVGEKEPFRKIDDLSELFALDINTSLFQEIVEGLKKEKTKAIIGYLSQKNNQQLYQSLQNNENSQEQHICQEISISIPLAKLNYSVESYDKARVDLVKKIQKIIDLLKFLVHFTNIDERFV